MKNSYVVVFHNGNMRGDCSEASIEVDSLNITFAQAMKKLLTAEEAVKAGWAENVNDVDNVEDFIACMKDEFVGAWIIDGEVADKFNEAWKYANEPGGDSECYAMQAMNKGFSRAFSVKNIGRAAK